MDAQNPYQTPQTGNSFNPTEAYVKTGLFSFKGRYSRKSYWMVSLGMMAIWLPIVLIAEVAGESMAAILLLVLLLAYIPLVWIGLATTVKRWHDRGKSGWWILIGLIPIVGPIWSFVECGFLVGTSGPNQYGGDPLQK